MQIASRNEFACVFHPKIHQICNQPVFIECSCSKLTHNENNQYVSCRECLLDACDYVGKFKCPNANCNKELTKNPIVNESKLDEYRNKYKEQIKLNLNNIVLSLVTKAFATKQSLKGKSSFKS
jgi:hypothetical protein